MLGRFFSTYFLWHIGENNIQPLAVVSHYGAPHPGLLAESSKTYWTAQHLHDSGLEVVSVKSIDSVVMMALDK